MTTRVSWRLFALPMLCVVFAGFLSLQTAIAQEASSIASSSENGKTTSIEGVFADPLTPEGVDKAMAGLTDKEVRQVLAERLAVEAQQTGQAVSTPVDTRSVVDYIVDTVIATAATVSSAVIHTPEMVSAVYALIADYVASIGWDGAVNVTVAFAVAFGLGTLAEFLFDRRMLKWRGRISDAADMSQHSTLLKTVGTLSKRLISDVSGVILFFFIVTVTLILLIPEPQVAVARMLAVWLILFPRISITLLHFLFVPDNPSLRLVYTDDWTARFLYRNYVGIIVTIGIVVSLAQFVQMVGTLGDDQKVGFWLNLIIFVWMAIITVRERNGIRMMIRGRSDTLTRVEAWAADVYPWFALAVIVSTYLISLVLATLGLEDKLRGGRHYETLALLLLAPILDTAIRALVHHLQSPMRGEGPLAERAYLSLQRSYTRMGRVIVFGSIILFIANIWDVSLVDTASAGLGAHVASNIVELLLILAVGYFASETFSLLIDRKLANNYSVADIATPIETHNSVEQPQPSTRLATVLPLLRRAIQIFIVVITVLAALESLGANVTSILAGAGIFGIAIGFGSQKLVADVVSGFFFLLDDAFRVGEWVDIGGDMAGTVEKFNIRSLQLRHHRGAMHCVPYGSISRVTNASRGYSIMKLKFTVPYDTDIELVKRIFKQIGQQLLEHPELSSGIIETFKSQGVFEVNEQGIVIRGKYMTKPGRQFEVRKEVYRLVKQEFEKNGIEFARKEVHVAVSDDKSEPESKKIAAAAAASESAGWQD